MGIRHELFTTVALRGHSNRVAGCPLSGVKRTSHRPAEILANDPKRRCRGLWSQQLMFQRSKERPIRERSLNDWYRWMSARPAPAMD